MASSAEGRRRRSGSGGADAVAVREGLREVLAQLEPLIKSSGSSANFAGMLAFLEETDDGFQHSQLVRWMRQQLEAALGTMVAEEVALQCRESELTPHKMKLVAPAILQKVLQVSIYSIARHQKNYTLAVMCNSASGTERRGERADVQNEGGHLQHGMGHVEESRFGVRPHLGHGKPGLRR